MGSMIHLAVGRLEIDWGKNLGFRDHSALFQPSDLTDVPYYYAREDRDKGSWDVITEYKPGLSKPLHQVVDRMNLLGHTMNYARHEFDYITRLNNIDSDKFNFDILGRALLHVDVSNMSSDYGEGGEDFGKFFRRYIFDRLNIGQLVDDSHYVKFNVSEGMENLSPYTILQLLSRNSSAMELPVNWQFSDVEDSGWGHRDQFVKTLDPENRFLIVTEGSSDAKILKHAFALLRPHVADFFQFVDMAEGYPFSGTGNLFNFTKGLISISVQNLVVIVYDNDAEGVYNFNRSQRLNIPDNMRVLKLPDLHDFNAFPTIGPDGTHSSDINGKAAAIECYLEQGSNPVVRWTQFNKELGTYHGELTTKADVIRRFLGLRDASSDFDFTRIRSVIDSVEQACVAMRDSLLLAGLKKDIEALPE